jgi:hypothetical protein
MIECSNCFTLFLSYVILRPREEYTAFAHIMLLAGQLLKTTTITPNVDSKG